MVINLVKTLIQMKQNIPVLFPRDKTELNKTEISYKLSDPIASISMDSKLSIDYDKQYNTFNITVTAGDGVTKKTYHINVKPIPSTNNEVDHIVINGDEVKDVEGTFTYSIFVLIQKQLYQK